MSDVSTITVIKKSIKEHLCEHCWQLIPIGSSYTRHTGIFDGTPFTVKSHTECNEAYGKFNEGSDDYDWLSLDNMDEFPEHKEAIRKKYNLGENHG